MDRPDRAIGPKTIALDRLIRAACARIGRASAVARDALLFLGNVHDAIPALLISDPVLEPVDKILWMVLHQAPRRQGDTALLPDYEQLAHAANVASTATVARALAILRATRWLSRCGHSRDRQGRFSVNVYALHDEPLPLADTLHLDPDYPAFLEASQKHHHARVRLVATAALAALAGAELKAGGTPLETPLIERRLAARHRTSGEARRYFEFRNTELTRLHAMTATDHPQNLKAAHRLQNLKAVSGSSSYFYKTTTTEPPTDPGSSRASAASELVFPARLCVAQCASAAQYLDAIAPDLRQAVLDELAGRIAAEKQGAAPVFNDLRYLRQLCRQALRGGFAPNLGHRIRAAREAAMRKAPSSPPAPTAAPSAEIARAAMSVIRKRLGAPDAEAAEENY